MNVYLTVIYVLNVFLVFAEIVPRNFESQTNIRHSRSRLLRGRRHGDEIHEDLTTASILQIPSLNSKQFITESSVYITDNISINSNKDDNIHVIYHQLPYSMNDTSANQSSRKNTTSLPRKKSINNRKVTVGSSLNNQTNNSWQHVDKSVLYMGERALNQMEDNKRKNKTHIQIHQQDKQNRSIDNQDETFLENTFIDNELEEEEEMEGSAEKSAVENARTGHIDIVTRFLRIVESQHLLGENCTAGTDLNLGEGVVDRYAQERFRVEADVAVNRANMLTRLWKYADPNVVMSEYLLHASVFSMVEFDDDIFAAGNCYDQYQYKDYWLFCPYAYRLPQGSILVKDLAVEYKYHSNTSEWFYIARKNAENVIRNFNQFSKGK